MTVVKLVPADDGELRAFAEAQIEDYAAWLVERGDAVDLAEARARARAEIEPEQAAAVTAGDRFWSAHDADDRDEGTVGWLWVQVSLPKLPPGTAFLYQILVRADVRREGYGSGMLLALERVLAEAGYQELRLNVWDSNLPARRLYKQAGYETAELLSGKRQLRKRLAAPGAARDTPGDGADASSGAGSPGSRGR